MIPLIIKQAADEAIQNIKDMAKRQLQAEKEIPSYKEMRAARLHPDMSEKERWAYRADKVQKGYVGGTIGGGLLGGVTGATIGDLLERTRFGKSMPGVSHMVRKWILPASIGYTGYRLGAIKGRKIGERYARKKLNESGNPIPYVNPISVTDRGAADPVFMGTMMGAKTIQAAASEKAREKVEQKILGSGGTKLRDLFKQDWGFVKDKLKGIKFPRFN